MSQNVITSWVIHSEFSEFTATAQPRNHQPPQPRKTSTTPTPTSLCTPYFALCHYHCHSSLSPTPALPIGYRWLSFINQETFAAVRRSKLLTYFDTGLGVTHDPEHQREHCDYTIKTQSRSSRYRSCELLLLLLPYASVDT